MTRLDASRLWRKKEAAGDADSPDASAGSVSRSIAIVDDAEAGGRAVSGSTNSCSRPSRP